MYIYTLSYYIFNFSNGERYSKYLTLKSNIKVSSQIDKLLKLWYPDENPSDLPSTEKHHLYLCRSAF